MDISKQSTQLYGHDTTSTASILLENLVAIILIFMVRNTSIEKASIYLVYAYKWYIQVDI